MEQPDDQIRIFLFTDVYKRQILSQDDGSAIFIKVLDRYLYSYINVYDNCFICGIDKEEIDLKDVYKRQVLQFVRLRIIGFTFSKK